MLERFTTPRRTAPWIVDAGVALLVQLAVTIPFVVPRDPSFPRATWLTYGMTTLAVVPLLWRRRAPVASLLAVVTAQGCYGLLFDGPGQPLPYAGLVGVYTVAALSAAPRRLAVVAVSLVLIPVGVRLNTGEPRELLFTLFVDFGAYGLGALARTRQAFAAAERERAAEGAAARERARIAREMHDVLSHSVALMVVQAEAGPVAVRAAPERAEAAFDAIAETGRDALAQLRRMLGVLRDDSGAGAAPDADEPRAPEPGVAQLPALAARVSESGVRVAYGTTGRVRPLPPDVGSAAYRIVQEALTNVVRHAGAANAEVRLGYGDDRVTISVTDDGRGPVPGRAGGHGLAGVRERAAAHGGTVRTGPGPGGRGFGVSVSLEVGRE